MEQQIDLDFEPVPSLLVRHYDHLNSLSEAIRDRDSGHNVYPIVQLRNGVIDSPKYLAVKWKNNDAGNYFFDRNAPFYEDCVVLYTRRDCIVGVYSEKLYYLVTNKYASVVSESDVQRLFGGIKTILYPTW
jgi:hypothetical protein